jgi:hypothetical protein
MAPGPTETLSLTAAPRTPTTVPLMPQIAVIYEPSFIDTRGWEPSVFGDLSASSLLIRSGMSWVLATSWSITSSVCTAESAWVQEYCSAKTEAKKIHLHSILSPSLWVHAQYDKSQVLPQSSFSDCVSFSTVLEISCKDFFFFKFIFRYFMSTVHGICHSLWAQFYTLSLQILLFHCMYLSILFLSFIFSLCTWCFKELEYKTFIFLITLGFP